MTDPILQQDPTLAEIVQRLVRALGPERIYLFGSRARGDAGPDSDYDLLVVLKRLAEPGYRMSQKAHRLLRDLPVAADIVFWQMDDFEWRAGWRSSFPATVLREGRVLHAV